MIGNCAGDRKCRGGEPIRQVFLYKGYIVYSTYVIRYFMTLVYVISSYKVLYVNTLNV